MNHDHARTATTHDAPARPRGPASVLVEADRREFRSRPGRTGTAWRSAWMWGPDTERLVRAKLADLPRPVLHIGCGASRAGDIRLDRFYPAPDLRADAKQTPFKDASVGTVLQDPPWTKQHLAERQEWVSEAMRVLRVGGFYVLHAPYMLKRPTLLLEEVHVRDDSEFNMFPGPPIILSIWRKLKDGARRE